MRRASSWLNSLAALRRPDSDSKIDIRQLLAIGVEHRETGVRLLDRPTSGEAAGMVWYLVNISAALPWERGAGQGSAGRLWQ
jgi:hypothetical protein